MATLKQNSEALRAITDKLKSLPKKNELVELEVTENGEYTPPENADGFSKVTVATESKFTQHAQGALTEITEKDLAGVTVIRQYAFNYTPATQVNFPITLSTVGEFAFRYARSLKLVEFPNKEVKVNRYAFGDCTALEKVVIKGTLNIAGNNAFYKCTNLSEVDISKITVFGDSDFQECTNLKNAVINANPSTSSFASSGVENVTITENVTKLGLSAFTYCTALKTIAIPASVTKIDTTCFRGCTVLETVTIKATTPPTFGTNVFQNCTALSQIIVPTGTANAYKTATNWSTYADKIVEESSGEAEGNWLFQNEQITGMTITGLPAPVIGNSYTCFVDGEEIATARCEEKWDGTPYISFSTEDYRVWLLYDTTVGDTDWYFNPMDSQVQSGSVSIRINYDWLFKDEVITGEARSDLPFPVSGVSYTAFVDDVEIGTETASESGSLTFEYNSEANLFGSSDAEYWCFEMFGPGEMSATVSIRING